MGGVAKDYGQIMGTLMRDLELKNLLLIPLADNTNYSKLMTDYFVETFTVDTITTSDTVQPDKLCRLVIHSAPSNNTSNMMVREDSLVIEVYVSTKADRFGMDLFERRIDRIADKVIKLFHRQMINDRTFRLEARHELSCSIPGFKRMYLMFSYRKVYS